MTERYDAIVAAHYAAYRPPLHKIILGRVLANNEGFHTGVDLGCGTGYSAIALTPYCERVFGVDLNLAMLNVASVHEQVVYVNAASEHLPLHNRSADIVTLAGSLFYTDLVLAAREIGRICRAGAVVVVYDFEILLSELFRQLGLNSEWPQGIYDHRVNLSGVRGFAELAVENDRVSVPVAASELAHIVLSDSHRFDHYAKRQVAGDPYPALEGTLRSLSDNPAIEADIYYATYKVVTA
jgi:SAM-dependent methyltransferase